MGDNKQRNFDRISNLSDSLLGQILSYLSTKESISTSVLSKRWRDLWLQASVFDLHYEKCRDDDVYMRLLDRFLSPDNEQQLEKFRLIYENYENDDSRFKSWINVVIKHKIRHLVIHSYLVDEMSVQMPISLYSCDRLVYLELSCVYLVHPESVVLPCLKVINFDYVNFNDEWTLETLISSCPVLEQLTINRDPNDSLEVLRIRSRSVKLCEIFSEWSGNSD